LLSTAEQEGIIIYSVTDGLSSEHTKRNYRKNFSHFLKATQQTERGLLNQAQQNTRLVESLIINHIRYLAEKQRLSHGSIKTCCFSIFHFFEMNDIVLNKRKIIRFLPPNEGTREDRAYTHEEIHQILDKCDERSRVIVLLMASTGLRIGAIPVIQIGDLTKVDEYDLYKITVYANSPKDRYYTFCTPECKKAIDSYLAYRERFGEKFKPSSPLIREQFDIRDPFHGMKPKNISEDSVFWTIKQLLKRAGKVDKVKQSHGFRKFAITQMIKAKVDYDSREYLVGHKGSRGLGVNYDRTTEDDRLQGWSKAIPLLEVNPTRRLERQVDEYESERRYWREYGEQMIEMYKQMDARMIAVEEANKAYEATKTKEEKRKDREEWLLSVLNEPELSKQLRKDAERYAAEEAATAG
jgi:integrase